MYTYVYFRKYESTSESTSVPHFRKYGYLWVQYVHFRIYFRKYKKCYCTVHVYKYVYLRNSSSAYYYCTKVLFYSLPYNALLHTYVYICTTLYVYVNCTRTVPSKKYFIVIFVRPSSAPPHALRCMPARAFISFTPLLVPPRPFSYAKLISYMRAPHPALASEIWLPFTDGRPP